jgi:hypothetical protein
LERATTKHTQALKAAIPLSFLGRAKSLLAIFGGLPGVITLAIGALFVWNQRAKDAEDGAEDLKQKLLNLGKSQAELAEDTRIATKTLLEQERVLAQIALKEDERKLKELESAKVGVTGVRGFISRDKLQRDLDEKRKSIEDWGIAIEKVNKEIEESKKPPEDLTGAGQEMLRKLKREAKTFEDHTNKVEDNIKKLEIARDKEERLAKAYTKGEKAVAALNAELEIENALRGAGTNLTLDQAAAIIREVRARQKATGAIEDMKDARREEAEAAEAQQEAAEDAAREIQAPFDRAAENIQRGLGDAFTNAFRHGKLEFETFADLVKDVMARMAGEIAALLVFRPQLFGGGLGGLGLFGSSAASAGGAAGTGGLGALLAGANPLLLGAGGILGGTYLGGGFGSTAGTAGGLGGGLLGAGLGGYLGFALGGPLGSLGTMALGSLLGGLGGGFLGGGIGSLFGGNDKQKFGFNTGAGGLQTPFGGLSVSTSQNIDAGAIVRSLAGIDESIARLLSPEQIGRVRGGLAGTGQFYSAHSFDNESFDVVKTRLVRIIDAVAENTVASGLLNQIGRSPENIDELVQAAGGIIEMINLFQNNGAELNTAEQALKALNEQFDDLADAAKKLGFDVGIAEAKRQQAIEALTADFNTSIKDQILAIQDPLRATLAEEERIAEERLDNARTLGANIADVERLNGLRRAQIIEQAFSGPNSSIESFLSSLRTTGAGGLGINAQAKNAEALFNSLLSPARTDPAARQQLAGLLPQLVNLKREQLGSTAQFFQFTRFLDSTLTNLVDQTDTVTILESIGSAITLGDNAIVSALREENELLRDQIAELSADIRLVVNAPSYPRPPVAA